MAERKQVTGALAVKDSVQGLVSAVFADMTAGLVDRDGDTYDPGALRPGTGIPVSAWAHDAAYPGGSLPVGVATVRTSGVNAVADIAYWLDLPRGREAFEVVKRLGNSQWSWTLDIHRAVPTSTGRRIVDVSALEVSPVLQAAGIGTRTVSAKQAQTELLRAIATVTRLRVPAHRDRGAVLAERARSRSLGVPL